MEIYKVILSTKAKRDLLKVPKYIIKKLSYWIDEVGNEGLSTVRKIPGYHDEPLKGTRVGQRSIRLNRSYRAIYEVDQSDVIHFIAVLEVNKHEY
jgi:toxin HigB-1